MTGAANSLDSIEIVGGHPAVDFVNTVHSWHADPPPDFLHGFDDFIAWNRMSGLLGPGSGATFGKAANPQKAKAFREAVALREHLHRLMLAVASGSPLPADALEHLDGIVRRTAAWRHLAADEKSGATRLGWAWDFSDAPAAAALGPVAWAAVDLLERGALDRLKECPGERCGWLFLDTSRNRSRTWCSMKTCGNSAKVKRYRQRTNA